MTSPSTLEGHSTQKPMPELPITIPIAAVERDTGLSKDTLRIWERRYGFPRPLRDAHGERVYPLDQVERLGVIKRLLDQGLRPGRIMGLAPDQLKSLAERASLSAAGERGATTPFDGLIARVREHRLEDFRRELEQILLRLGLARFVCECIAPLTALVGEAWTRGELEVFEEHLYTESVQGILRSAIQALPASPARPRVLLTTFPNEAHGLGVLMAEAIFCLEGARCMSLGVMTPLRDIVLAARSQQADIVALSFSPVLSPAVVVQGLGELAEALPTGVELWAGGSNAALRRRALRGLGVLRSLDDIAPALAAWRERHTG